MTIDVAAGAFRFEWLRIGSDAVVARGKLMPSETKMAARSYAFDWVFEREGQRLVDQCGATSASVHAMLKRVGLSSEFEAASIRFGLLVDKNMGIAKAGKLLPLSLNPGEDPWKSIARHIILAASLRHIRFAVMVFCFDLSRSG